MLIEISHLSQGVNAGTQFYLLTAGLTVWVFLQPQAQTEMLPTGFEPVLPDQQ
jgi:hypothetical protein